MPREAPDPALGVVLRRVREEVRKETQQAIAVKSGMALAGYSRIELGQTNPSWTTVVRLAKALGLTVAELAAMVEAEQSG